MKQKSTKPLQAAIAEKPGQASQTPKSSRHHVTMEKPEKRFLVEEIDFYNQNKKQFVDKHTNRYLLIKGRELIASFPTQDEAVGEGVRRFGAGPFLVRLSGADTPRFIVPVLGLGLPCQS